MADAKLVPHPLRHARFGIGQRGIERQVAPAALPDNPTIIQNPDERTRLVAVADLDIMGGNRRTFFFAVRARISI
jgi:hypothetical protein